MKKIATLLLTFFLLLSLTSCFKRGPYPAPLTHPVDEIVKIDLVDGRNGSTLFQNETYSDNVIYTLNSQERIAFIEGLQSIEFYLPGYEPARHIGKIVARIYYKNGNSDLIGSNCNYYFVGDVDDFDRHMYYPDKEAFYALFEKFVDQQLLPR